MGDHLQPYAYVSMKGQAVKTLLVIAVTISLLWGPIVDKAVHWHGEQYYYVAVQSVDAGVQTIRVDPMSYRAARHGDWCLAHRWHVYAPYAQRKMWYLTCNGGK